MQLPALSEGRIINRYKRFLADVELPDGRLVTVHCPNTGAMTGCWEPGAPVQISHSDNPRRKLAWTLERVDMGNGWIGVNTHRVNPVVAEALASGAIASLRGYSQLRREVSVEVTDSRSRLDLVLEQGAWPDAYIEVKNVTLLEGNRLCFPDAVTERGRKHLDTLIELVKTGRRGIMIYALNRPEGSAFSPADHVDAAYGRRLREAVGAGVELLALRIDHTPTAMRVAGTVPVELPG